MKGALAPRAWMAFLLTGILPLNAGFGSLAQSGEYQCGNGPARPVSSPGRDVTADLGRGCAAGGAGHGNTPNDAQARVAGELDTQRLPGQLQ